MLIALWSQSEKTLVIWTKNTSEHETFPFVGKHARLTKTNTQTSRQMRSRQAHTFNKRIWYELRACVSHRISRLIIYSHCGVLLGTDWHCTALHFTQIQHTHINQTSNTHTTSYAIVACIPPSCMPAVDMPFTHASTSTSAVATTLLLPLLLLTRNRGDTITRRGTKNYWL